MRGVRIKTTKHNKLLVVVYCLPTHVINILVCCKSKFRLCFWFSKIKLCLLKTLQMSCETIYGYVAFTNLKCYWLWFGVNYQHYKRNQLHLKMLCQYRATWQNSWNQPRKLEPVDSKPKQWTSLLVGGNVVQISDASHQPKTLEKTHLASLLVIVHKLNAL